MDRLTDAAFHVSVKHAYFYHQNDLQAPKIQSIPANYNPRTQAKCRMTVFTTSTFLFNRYSHIIKSFLINRFENSKNTALYTDILLYLF